MVFPNNSGLSIIYNLQGEFCDDPVPFVCLSASREEQELQVLILSQQHVHSQQQHMHSLRKLRYMITSYRNNYK